VSSQYGREGCVCGGGHLQRLEIRLPRALGRLPAGLLLAPAHVLVLLVPRGERESLAAVLTLEGLLDVVPLLVRAPLLRAREGLLAVPTRVRLLSAVALLVDLAAGVFFQVFFSGCAIHNSLCSPLHKYVHQEGTPRSAHPTHRTGTAFRPPPPPSCTKWTRRVPHPVLIGHAASLTPYRHSVPTAARKRVHASRRNEGARADLQVALVQGGVGAVLARERLDPCICANARERAAAPGANPTAPPTKRGRVFDRQYRRVRLVRGEGRGVSD
jgi:hypothetical protein